MVYLFADVAAAGAKWKPRAGFLGPERIRGWRTGGTSAAIKTRLDGSRHSRQSIVLLQVSSNCYVIFFFWFNLNEIWFGRVFAEAANRDREVTVGRRTWF